jgi:nitrogen regulatory protein P-II 1
MMMKMIIAVIRPEKFEQVEKALAEKGFPAMTVSEVRGRGEQKGIALRSRGGPVTVDLIPKIRIEMAVSATFAETVVQIIREAARTGRIGDGKVFVLPLDMAAKVRTEEVSI